MRLKPVPRRVGPGLIVPVLIVLVLVGSALSLVLALTRPDPGPPLERPGNGPDSYVAAPLAGEAGPAVAALVEALPVVLGYDHRDLAGGLAEATALMTPGFAESFTRSYNTSARPLARRQRAVAQALVRGAGVVRVVDPDTVVALAYVDQVLTSQAPPPDTAAQVVTRSRVLVRLVLVGGTWQVDNVSPV